MAVRYLVDTSVLKRVRIEAVRDRVERLASESTLARASTTDLEIGFSARNAGEWDQLVGALAAFDLVEIGPEHFQRAGQVQRLLAERGLRGRKIPDLLVAAAAEAESMTVLHYDADFDHIASLTGQPTGWISPAGTID